MREGEFSVQAIFGAMLDGLVVVDEQRRVQMMNPAFRAVVRIGKDRAGRHRSSKSCAMPSVDRAVTETIRARASRDGSHRVSRGLGRKSRDRSQCGAASRKLATHRGAVVLFRDVTQLRRVEEMRRDFVANVSHELRTPLSIFRGYLETLLEDPQQPPGELLPHSRSDGKPFQSLATARWKMC